MVNCGIKLKTMSYEESCSAVWGRPGYYVVALVCFLIDFGVLVAYFVAMGSLAGPIATDYFSITEAVETKVKLAAAVVMLPPSYLRSLGDIPGWSYVSYAMILFGSFSMLYLAFSDSTQEFNKVHVAPLNVPVETDWSWVKGGIWQAIGTIAFTFAIHDCVFSIFKSLKDGTRERWSFVCYTALATTTALILAIGVPIYLALGDKVDSNITKNFPSGPLMNAVRGAIFVCVIITWVYVQHVGRKYLHSLVMPLVRCRPLTSSETYTMSAPELAVFTTVIFVAALCLGIMCEDLGIPMSLTGIFAQSLSAFVIPPCLVFTMVRQGQNPGYSTIELGFLAVILVFGLVSCTLGMHNTLNAHLGQAES